MLAPFYEMESNLATWQLQRLCEAFKFCDPPHVNVLTRRVDVLVDGDERRLHDIEAGEAGTRHVGERGDGCVEKRIA